MARFSYTLHGTFDGGADQINTVDMDVPDTEMPYFFDAYRTTYGQVHEDPNDPSSPMRDMTDLETFQKYATGLANGTMANVRRDREVKAMQDAVSGLPPPFEPTMGATSS